jgi:hypothetical protein
VLRLSAFAIEGAECRAFARERNCLTSAEVQGFSFTFFFIRSVLDVIYAISAYNRVKAAKLNAVCEDSPTKIHSKSAPERTGI